MNDRLSSGRDSWNWTDEPFPTLVKRDVEPNSFSVLNSAATSARAEPLSTLPGVEVIPQSEKELRAKYLHRPVATFDRCSLLLLVLRLPDNGNGDDGGIWC